MKLTMLLFALAAVTGTAFAEDGPKFAWERFKLEEREAFFILPAEVPGKSIPWVFYAPTFGTGLPNEKDEGWMIEKLLAAGVAIAGIDVGESYGSPKGVAQFDALHKHLVDKHGFAKKAGLLARSRGGLMLYNWATVNPDKVHCIAGVYPVCDLASYPGLAKACGAYGLTEADLKKDLAKHNPVDRLAPLAKAKIPIFHIHGDKDKLVPMAENSREVATRYEKLGGKMELKVAEGQWHNLWRGFFECEELVKFLVQHTSVKD